MQKPIIFAPHCSPQRRPFMYSNRFFSAHDVQRIITLGDALPLGKALVGSSNPRQDDRSRIAQGAFIEADDESSWLFDKLAQIVSQWNDECFGLDLIGFCEQTAYITYEAPSGHYRWHVGCGKTKYPRKLSVSLLLSGPEDHEGGDLEVWLGDEPMVIPKHRGMLAVFPSYTMHRVTPVTKGVRKSLVAWVNGPDFR